MSDAGKDEKRQYSRVGAELGVRIRLGNARLEYPAVFTRDVSSGGIGLEIAAEWPDSFSGLMSWKGPVEVELELAPDHVSHVKAAVVWGHVHGEEGEARRFRMGLRFVEISDDDRTRLLDFVRSKMVESMLGGGPPPDDPAREEPDP